MNPAIRFGRASGMGRFVAFVATSGSSVVVNLVARYLFSGVMIFEAAVACAYVISTAVAFALARWLVFGSSGDRWQRELGRFLIVNVFGFLQVLAISAALVRLVFPAIGFGWHPEEIAHLLGLASLAVTSYHAHRRFSFGGAAAPREIRR